MKDPEHTDCVRLTNLTQEPAHLLYQKRPYHNLHIHVLDSTTKETDKTNSIKFLLP